MKLTRHRFKLNTVTRPNDFQETTRDFETTEIVAYLITKKLDFMLWNRLVVEEQLNLLV